jgi:hypothetical protein
MLLKNKVLDNFFSLSVFVSICPEKMEVLTSTYNRIRNSVKQNQSITSSSFNTDMYSLLYGCHAAYEEALIQATPKYFSAILKVDTADTSKHFINVLGMKIHSGDILISRGGAVVSALIARSGDYPGNYSHAALLHVDAKKNKATLIEAHIEKGVALSDMQTYLKDKKMRILVLRVKPDLASHANLKKIPDLVAAFAMNDAKSRKINYDFELDDKDSSKMFCSEVVSYAYKTFGIDLWKSKSTISNEGIAKWLHEFGVTHFTTELPSDLEYDPNLNVVYEWRDSSTLAKDHLDNAVMDVLYEKANSGVEITYNRWMLPIARVIKLECMMLNYFNATGSIPEGMSATSALKNQWLVNIHNKLKEELQKEVSIFRLQNHYMPPYWEMINMARRIYIKQNGD